MEVPMEKLIKNLKDIPTSISQELIECSCSNQQLSENAKVYIVENLVREPYETSLVIKALSTQQYENLFQRALDSYTKLNDENEIFDQEKLFYLLLSNLNDNDGIDSNILQKIFELVKDEKLDKSLVYLALIPNFDLLNKVLIFEKNLLKDNLDIDSLSQIFDYCLQKRHHWLIYFLENDFTQKLTNSKFVIQKLSFLKLIYQTKEIDFDKTKACLGTIEAQSIKNNDQIGFEQFFFKEVKRILTLYENFQSKNIDFDQFFLKMSSLSCLEAVHTLLGNFDQEGQIRKLLQLNESFNDSSESKIFTGYLFLNLIQKYFHSNFDIADLKMKAKQEIFPLVDYDFQLKILELAFILVVKESMREADFLSSKLMGVANFLKNCLKKITFENKKSDDYRRLNLLLKCINDFLFRLDLIKFQKVQLHKINILHADPKTLVHACLENNDFGKAHQVIEVFNVKDPELESNIDFMEKYQYSVSKVDNLDPELMIRFFKENNNDCEESIYMDLFDFLLTTPLNRESSLKILTEVQSVDPIKNTHHHHFTKNLKNIYQHLDCQNFSYHILIKSQISLNYDKFLSKKLFNDNIHRLYQIFLENYDEDTFFELSQTASNASNDTNYLLKLFNYLKNLSNLLQNDKDMFALLKLSRAVKIGELFFIKKIAPRELESVFNNLELDIIYYISYNCVPKIKLHLESYQKKVAEIDLDWLTCSEDVFELIKKGDGNQLLTVDKLNLLSPDFALLSYVRRRNWLLAYLINKIHEIEEAKPDTNSDRTKFFNNLLNLRQNQSLKFLFDNNPVVTALQSDLTLDSFTMHSIMHNWESLHLVVDNIPERILFNSSNLLCFRDYIICKLVSLNVTTPLIVQTVNSNELRVKCILQNLKWWPGQICVEILENEITNADNDEEIKNELRNWLNLIKLYENLVFEWKEMNSWYDVYLQSMDNPKLVFQWLLDTPVQLSILLEWLKLNKTAANLHHNLITNGYLIKILTNVNLKDVKQLLDILPFDHRINLLKTLLQQVKQLTIINFLLDYLIALLPETSPDYTQVKLSLKIMSCFNSSEHENMWPLINNPILIIEQLLMNTRLEKLKQVLSLLTNDEGEFVKSVDKLICVYGEKSLAFRGIQPNIQKKSMEFKLLQSLDTLSDDTNESKKNLNFIMPENVPTKEEWIKNEMAMECMCCQTVIFSMFNRRHHCRRCGRVVCGNCSTKRIQLLDYGNIPVRVCDDCFKQCDDRTSSSLHRSDDRSSKSGSNSCWILNDDEKHNEMAREEFSYEYAPSVSLCLSIMKLHSETIQQPRFLLRLAKKLLVNLQETIAIREIDYSFLIQMLKSLGTAAKMICLNLNFKEELSSCQNMLLEVELLGLLAAHGCLHILPDCQPKQKKVEKEEFNCFSSTVLRKLNEKLMELEEWNVALEISTKAGLDNKIIFANWGMSCLRSGALQSAREKFHYCLEKNYFHDVEMNVSSNVSNASEGRPAKTPPLVNEIISTLESKTESYQNFESLSSSVASGLNNVSGADPALCVLDKLKRLQNIISGEKELTDWTNSKFNGKSCFYNECLYYLHKYGSHLSILRFYLRHNEYWEALNYILENRLPTDTFVEVYMGTIENNHVDQLHEQMQKIDPNLYVWEVYLRSICSYLEKNQMLNLLYNLQLFVCDYVRAAMTCIRFYKEGATNFTELNDREHLLLSAESHLKQELQQEQWVKVTNMSSPSRKLSSASSDSSNFQQDKITLKINPRNIDKHINTIWRQIEIVKFLSNCDNNFINQILKETLQMTDANDKTTRPMPTLFDSNMEKIQLATLCLLCGRNVEDGFGMAFRIMHDYKLKHLKVYCIAAKYMINNANDINKVLELISCIKSSGQGESLVNETCDEILTICIHELMEKGMSGGNVQREKLIKLMNDPAAKINAYIECKQLKCGYLLAVQHNRNNDIRRILREADKLNQPQIKAICIKRLTQTQ